MVIVGIFWVITTGEEDDIDNLLGRGEDCYQSAYNSQDNFPQQRMIGSKIAVVRRLRNSSLNVLLSWVLLPLLRYCQTIGHTFFSLPNLIIKRKWWVKNERIHLLSMLLATVPLYLYSGIFSQSEEKALK